MNTGNIAIYQNEDGSIKLNAKLEEETIWLTQSQMVDLFQSSKTNISEHISKIFEECGLDDSVVRNFRAVQKEWRSVRLQEISHTTILI